MQKYDKKLFTPKHLFYSLQRCKTLNTFKKTTLKAGTDNKHDPKKIGSKINHSNLVSKFDQIWNLIRGFGKKNLVICLCNANPATVLKMKNSVTGFDNEKFSNWFR